MSCLKWFDNKGQWNVLKMNKWIKGLEENAQNMSEDLISGLPHTQGIQGTQWIFKLKKMSGKLVNLDFFLTQWNSWKFWFFLKKSGKF